MKKAGLAVLFFCLSSLSFAQKIPDNLEQRLKACTACHGAEGRAGSDGFYPRIAGKPAGYLYNQLRNFRDGKRSYPAMRYMVAYMSDDYLQEIAAYFSGQHPPYAAPQNSDATPMLLEQGRLLVTQGDKARNLPACAACHGKTMTGAAPFVPGLLGLPRDYLIAQLGAWQAGNRKAHVPDCMQQIASRLNPQDIAAVSAWLAGQTIPDGGVAPPLQAGEVAHLPLQCGSLAH